MLWSNLEISLSDSLSRVFQPSPVYKHRFWYILLLYRSYFANAGISEHL